MDEETGVAHVQVKIDGGAWHMASYNSTTHAWTYTWNNPSSTRIWVHAMDFAGHVTEIYRDVTVSAPVVIYVSKNGNNNGWTWATAKLTVHDALDTAWAEGETAVWAAKGTYTERVALKSGVALYGGFVGNETSRDQRPAFPRQTPDSNATVVDGQGAGNVVSAGTVNVYTTVDGFSITNGGAYSGIHCDGSSAPSIANNTIQGNATGVRFPYATANGWVNHNIITSNGTGVSCEGTAGSVVIENNHIDHNGTTADRYGIGIRIANGASPTIERNWIEYNGSSSSGYEGGGIWCDSSTPFIRNNVIRANRGSNGGALFFSGSGVLGAEVKVTNNTIVDNYADVYGGGVYTRSSYIIIANNVVCGNNTGVYRNDFSGSVTLRNNCSYNTAQDYYHPPYVPLDSSYDFLQNPYLATDRIHLTSASTACINRGSATYGYGPYDIDGDARILNGVVDIGADERPL